MRRTIVSVVLGIIVLALGQGAFSALATLRTDPPRRDVAERSYNVSTFVVEKKTYQEVISAFGSAEADQQVTISAEVAGLITEVHPNLEVGVRVEPTTVQGGGPATSRDNPGDKLVKIDPSTYLRRIESLEQQISELEVQRKRLVLEEENEKRLLETQERNLVTAKLELESKRRSRDAGAGNSTQVRTAELQASQYEEQIVRLKNAIGLFESREASIAAQVESRSAELANARLDLDRTDVMAPFAGVLSMVQVEQGQYVRPGDPLVELTSLQRVDVPVALTQSQYARIEPLLAAGEQPVAFLAENETDEPRWTGRVVRSAPVADERTRTVNVYVEVDNSKQTTPLLPGTFVHARIDGPEHADLFVVPRDVILERSVYVVADASARSSETDDSGDPSTSTDSETTTSNAVVAQSTVAQSRQVDVWRTVQGLSIIKEGLAEGDRVVMTNLDVVHDGALVVPQAVIRVEDELQRQRTPYLKIVE